ncbi:hypothetical protein [Vallicoccus soli]|uniref:Uncharacterized protein n=1 Tax=Vallicoccus soli TaxID=2339232 RepID=A0A3A3YXH4_9ACTN|nr:hypothetical protein [Vallicoccus soli]RJK96379.1 hypothetical protein D5H78_09095 [Vallicoccus soli]
MTTTDTVGVPTGIPPQASGLLHGAGTSAPTAVPDEEVEARVAAATPLAGPTALPPQVAAVEDQAVTATWRNGVTIDALWSIDETRNAWARIPGVGWRKVYNGRDGAFLALCTLAAQARQTGRTVNLREDADGMIHEIYLW